MVTVLRTGSDKFWQVSTSQNPCEVLFFVNRESHAVQIWPTPTPACSFLTVPRSKLYDSPKWWKRISSRFSWRKVWNGVKCNFSSVHHHVRNTVGKLSIRRVRMWNFTRIRPKTKKLWLSIVPVQRPSEQPGLGPPQKVWTATFLGRTWTSHTLFKSSPSRKLKYTVSAWLAKR